MAHLPNYNIRPTHPNTPHNATGPHPSADDAQFSNLPTMIEPNWGFGLPGYPAHPFPVMAPDGLRPNFYARVQEFSVRPGQPRDPGAPTLSWRLRRYYRLPQGNCIPVGHSYGAANANEAQNLAATLNQRLAEQNANPNQGPPPGQENALQATLDAYNLAHRTAPVAPVAPVVPGMRMAMMPVIPQAPHLMPAPQLQHMQAQMQAQFQAALRMAWRQAPPRSRPHG